MKAGDLLYLTRKASPQFIRPIYFRLIRKLDFHTYEGWVWLEGYQIDEKGRALAKRELYVYRDGIKFVRDTTTSVVGRSVPQQSPVERRVKV